MINSILGAKKNINKILEESITNALFDNIYIYNNEDEKFNTLSNEKKQLIELFNQNVIYRKEGKEVNSSNNESLKSMLDDIKDIIYTEEDKLKLSECKLTY